MARKRKTGDTSYNARRREYRAAQRYLKQAQQQTGATAEKNRALAFIHLQNAINTYDPTQNQKIAAPIQRMAQEFGMTAQDIQKQREQLTQKQRTQAIKESQTALATVSDEVRREQEAKIVMNNPTISKRIMGGLVGIWGDKVKKGVSAEENREAITGAIFEHFKVSSWSEVLAKIEDIAGIDLYKVNEDYDIYDTVKLSLQIAVAGKRI